MCQPAFELVDCALLWFLSTLRKGAGARRMIPLREGRLERRALQRRKFGTYEEKKKKKKAWLTFLLTMSYSPSLESPPSASSSPPSERLFCKDSVSAATAAAAVCWRSKSSLAFASAVTWCYLDSIVLWKGLKKKKKEEEKANLELKLVSFKLLVL